MHARVRHAIITAGTALVASVTFGVGVLGAAAPAGAAPTSITDPADDTVTEAVEDPIAAPRADILSSTAESGPDGIALGIRLKQVTDPLTDPNWSGDGITSYANWGLDLNGDDRRDFEIEYAVDPETRALVGSLYRIGKGPRPADGCDPIPSFNPASGHSVRVDPKCLGNPASFRYQVELLYNTDINDDSSEVATDASPDDGWSEPVTVNLPAGVTPGTFPVVVEPQVTDPAPSSAPSSGVPTNTAPPSRSPNVSATTPTRPAAAQQAKPGAPRPANGSPDAPAVAASGLARTGMPDRTLRLAWFAMGIALIGAGLRFANQRPVGAHSLKR